MPVQRTLLISQDDFINRVNLSDEVFERYITPHISVVQDRYIKHTICEKLYNELIEEIDSGYVSEANQTLWDDYIKPYHVYQTYARYLINANAKSTPAGMIRNTGENYEHLSKEALYNLIKQAEEDALGYKHDLIQFLESNTATYILYDCCNYDKDLFSFKISGIGTNCENRGYFDRKNRVYRYD